MSDVVKSKRKQSKFEAIHQSYKVRNTVTQMILNNFGYDRKRYEERIARYAEIYKDKPNAEEITERYRRKVNTFEEWFIKTERDVVAGFLRDITQNIVMANSIYPVHYDEYVERRLCMDKAIGACFQLRQELQYVVEILPVDKQKWIPISDMIDQEIALLRGARQSDNRFLKTIQGQPLSVRSAANFANVNNNGNANNNNASSALGIRPISQPSQGPDGQDRR